ncbi:MAG TPA: hypothetical protein VHQ64_13845 [Pyrinomonadaceae bacterium]|nr:hypothetical protein [Pyrinomonadaceae bacterium]
MNSLELLLLTLVTALCWVVALSKSARSKLPTPWWIKSIGKSEAEQRLMTDILFRVGGVGGGVMFGLMAIIVLLQTFP